MQQDIRSWFTAVFPGYSRQFNTYSNMSIARHKITSGKSPLIVWHNGYARQPSEKCYMSFLMWKTYGMETVSHEDIFILPMKSERFHERNT